MKRKLSKFLVGLGIVASTIIPMKAHVGKVDKLERLVLSQTAENQTVMFGDKHMDYTYDSEFLIGILPELKNQGFSYLAIEIDRNPIDVFYSTMNDYVQGKIKREDIDQSLYVEIEIIAPGWMDLIDAAKTNGLEIVCYDAGWHEISSFNHREELSLKNLKELIFEKDPDAKVIVYCGNGHLSEKKVISENNSKWESINGIGSEFNKQYKCLGSHLNDYTMDKNLTINLKPTVEIEYCDLNIGDKLKSSRAADDILGTKDE